MSRHAGVRQIIAAIAPRLDANPLAVLLDVDGTLAPIAPRPSDARVPVATRAVIERLVSSRGVHVALVSGRAAHDATSMVGVEGIWALGNHGLELRAPDGAIEPAPAALEFEPAMTAVARDLDALAREVPGALLENKRWTLSLHYRLVEDARVQALVDRARAIVAPTKLRITEGKKIVEIRPPVAIDKGTSSCALAERLGAFEGGGGVLFAGDDRTDEDAFRALRARDDAKTITIRVGDEREDTVAEFLVPSTETLRELLATIAERRASGS